MTVKPIAHISVVALVAMVVTVSRQAVPAEIPKWRVVEEQKPFVNGDADRLDLAHWQTADRVIAFMAEHGVLADNASGRFTFDAPDSRAVLFHFRQSNSN